MNKEDVIRRLKEAVEEERSEDRELGKDCGRRWAESIAQPKQLRQVEKLTNDYGGIDGGIDWLARNGLGISWGLLCTINPTMCADLRQIDVYGFWGRVLGEDKERIHDKDFACGFVEGALEIWAEAKNKM